MNVVLGIHYLVETYLHLPIMCKAACSKQKKLGFFFLEVQFRLEDTMNTPPASTALLFGVVPVETAAEVSQKALSHSVSQWTAKKTRLVKNASSLQEGMYVNSYLCARALR